jgi:hypothetical protein
VDRRGAAAVNDAIPALSPGAVATAKVVLALAGAALAAIEIALARAGRAETRRALRTSVWIVLAIASIGTWTRLAPLRPGPHVHVWELYHHVLGAKYRHELGYAHLYDCTLAADVEAGFAIAPADRPIRRLATNRVERGDSVLDDVARTCRTRFEPARWDAFAADVAVLRAATPPRRWGTMLTDHGMNASPIWTIAGAAFADAIPITPASLRFFTWLDPVLLAALSAALAWAFGVRITAIAWIALGSFYFSDFAWIGGGFLRYDWLALAGIGAALVRRGWFVGGGFALTWATGVRIFPGFLVAAVVLHAGIDLLRRRSLRLAPAHRRFALGCLLAIATLGPLSVAVAGRDAWPAFVENSRKHLATPLLNFVGWRTVVSFDPATTAGALRDASVADPYEPWHAAVRANFERRRFVYAAGVVAFTLLLAAALARTPLAWAPLLGIGLTVVAAEIGAYYYALLALYAGLAERVPLAAPLLLAFAAASQGVATAVAGSQDVTFTALSALAAGIAIAMSALALRAPATRP